MTDQKVDWVARFQIDDQPESFVVFAGYTGLAKDELMKEARAVIEAGITMLFPLLAHKGYTLKVFMPFRRRWWHRIVGY